MKESWRFTVDISHPVDVPIVGLRRVSSDASFATHQFLLNLPVIPKVFKQHNRQYPLLPFSLGSVGGVVQHMKM